VAEAEARSKKLNIWSGKKYSEPVTKTPNPGGEYHGNRISYKFHEPGCRDYYCKNCTRVFKTRQAAINAGFIPCKLCITHERSPMLPTILIILITAILVLRSDWFARWLLMLDKMDVEPRFDEKK